MPEFASLMAFAAVALGLVLTPGPNMMYLTSRSICQGKRAGFISLAGVAVGFFLLYVVCRFRHHRVGFRGPIRLRCLAFMRGRLFALSGVAGDQTGRAADICGARLTRGQWA